mmetsp:Transcript_20117/g.35868  ORF Transcript_20117/g.35868 Transcript_20117/m.35868 type:complete len:735 (-) Transcript_20117:98-2302(-)
MNQHEWIAWLMEVPEPLNAISLRYRLEAEDAYNRTAFIAAIDSGSVDAAHALTFHAFSSLDVDAMVFSGIDVPARAKNAGKEMETWYLDFVERRRKLVVEVITNFYEPWPLPKILSDPEFVRKQNVSQQSAWPPLFFIPNIIDQDICRNIIRDTGAISSRKNTFGPQNMFAGVPRHDIEPTMFEFDSDQDGKLAGEELDEFIRFIMNRETGGVKELLGFRMPTFEIAKNIFFDRNHDGVIDFTGAERFSEEFHEPFNDAIFEESIKFESRVIRTQQSAQLSTNVAMRLSKYVVEKLDLPKWLDYQVQAIHSIPPGEHYGHHDDGAYRIFTAFVYCEGATLGGQTSFPFAIPTENGTGVGEKDRENVENYRMMDEALKDNRVFLSQMCEVERDCCDDDCNTLHTGPLPWRKGECFDDDASLRNAAIEQKMLHMFGGEITCKNIKLHGICEDRDWAFEMSVLCPVSCGTCDFVRRGAPGDMVTRVIPKTGEVKVTAKAGDVAVWPNYEHLPNGRVSQLGEAGHCGCPVRGGEKWSANLWFKLPTYFLEDAMRMMIRDQVVKTSQPGDWEHERQRVSESLEFATMRFEQLERDFDEIHLGFRGPGQYKCKIKHDLQKASGEDIFMEALRLEHAASDDRGARRMYFYKKQFEWVEDRTVDCADLEPECASLPEKDNRICRQSCGACGLVSRERCEDANSECAAMVADEGGCHGEQFRRECPVSCGLCQYSTTLRTMET